MRGNVEDFDAITWLVEAMTGRSNLDGGDAPARAFFGEDLSDRRPSRRGVGTFGAAMGERIRVRAALGVSSSLEHRSTISVAVIFEPDLIRVLELTYRVDRGCGDTLDLARVLNREGRENLAGGVGERNEDKLDIDDVG